MNRRRFLSTLGIGAVGLTKTDVLLGREGGSRQGSQARATTHAVTTTPDVDFTTRTVDSDSQAPRDAVAAFKDTFAEVPDSDAYPNLDYGLNDTALFIKEFLDFENETVLENKYIGRLQHWSFQQGYNPVRVAKVAAASAAAIKREQEPFDILDVNIVLPSDEADGWKGYPVNQSYLVRGGWIREFLDNKRDVEGVMKKVLGTAKTHHTTTATTTTTTTTPTTDTPTPDDGDDWTFSHNVKSDGTLKLIEGGLEGGYTLWGEYDRTSTHLYGNVENISGSTLNYAEVQANLYVNNAVVAQALANMRNLPAGHRWIFDALATEPVEFDYVDVYLRGNTY